MYCLLKNVSFLLQAPHQKNDINIYPFPDPNLCPNYIPNWSQIIPGWVLDDIRCHCGLVEGPKWSFPFKRTCMTNSRQVWVRLNTYIHCFLMFLDSLFADDIHSKRNRVLILVCIHRRIVSISLNTHFHIVFFENIISPPMRRWFKARRAAASYSSVMCFFSFLIFSEL